MLQSWKVDAQLEIMNGRYQRRNLLVDETEILALPLQKEILDIVQDEFALEMNDLDEEVRRCCEGCEIDEPSQMHQRFV